MKFFFDNCLSRFIAETLERLKVDVRHLQHEFPADIKDVELLACVGKEGWTFVTVDGRIRKNSVEAEALRKANIVSVFIPREFQKKDAWEQTIWMLKHWRDIAKCAEGSSPGTVVSVKFSGKPERQ